MRYVINIGAERSATQVKADPYQDDVKFWSAVQWREARAALRAVGFLLVKHDVVLPTQEMDAVATLYETTYVVELDVSRIPPGEVYLRLHAVAAALHQDCIAVRVFVGPGVVRRVLDEQLIGPAADAWKPFNPAYFKELS